MTLPLDTAPGPSPDAESQRNAGISRELLAKSRRELDAGDLLQASNKAWGAAAFALKAVAEKRRWFNEADWKLRRVAIVLSDEAADPAILGHYDTCRDAHFNFYRHLYQATDVRRAIAAAEYIIARANPTLAPSYTPPFVSAEVEEMKRRLEQPTSQADEYRLTTGLPPMAARPPVQEFELPSNGTVWE